MNAPKNPMPSTRALIESLALTSIDSTLLFNGKRELIIVHQGEAYRLRITRQEKLIMTK